ncbi:YitT family protein [Bacillaceae bacterium S4-13-56]
MDFVRKGLAIFFGSLILSIGINYFLVPFKVLDGGVIGLGLIMKYLIGAPAGLVIICISTPIFIIAWIRYCNYFYNSLHGLLVSSFFIDLLRTQQPVGLFGPVVSAVVGGILVGLGIGIMLRARTSTGGTDLLAQFISDFSGINVGILIFLMDALVISLGGYLFSAETFLLSIITICFVGLTTSLCTWNLPPQKEAKIIK